MTAYADVRVNGRSIGRRALRADSRDVSEPRYKPHTGCQRFVSEVRLHHGRPLTRPNRTPSVRLRCSVSPVNRLLRSFLTVYSVFLPKRVKKPGIEHEHRSEKSYEVVRQLHGTARRELHRQLR